MARWVDDRLGAARFARSALNKVFPDHWSFMIGELAPVLLRRAGAHRHLPDVLLRRRAPTRSIYDGSYEPLRGVEMTAGLPLGDRAQLRRAGRARHAPDPPLGGAAVPRRRSSCTSRGCSSPAPSGGPASSTGSSACTLLILAHLQRLRRLLAARRPALGHRSAHRLLDHAVDARRRHVAGVAAVRRRVPGPRHHQPALRHPHPAPAGRHRRAARRCTSASSSARSTRSSRARAGARTTSSASACGRPTRPRRSGCSS